jgi:hypothetical protein
LDLLPDEFPLSSDQIADSASLHLPKPDLGPRPGTTLEIGFVLDPPGPRSGGHTTLFRMVEALEAAGHRCVLYLHDPHLGSLDQREAVIRSSWPAVRAEVRTCRDGLAQLDAYVATAWHTAHLVATGTPFPTRRLYFVQDFEPLFYPAGSEYELALDTYRFGFTHITMGHMVARLLRERVGAGASVIEFGCDSSVYYVRDADAPRRGIAFFARPGVPRRGYELGVLALQEFHRSMPAEPIHLFGDAPRTTPFPAVHHGTLSPGELADLYNSVRAGLALSFSNVTLTAEEILACGAVPAINDFALIGDDFGSPFVESAAPTPRRLADALARAALAEPDRMAVSATARKGGWTPAKHAFVRAVEEAVFAIPDQGARS